MRRHAEAMSKAAVKGEAKAKGKGGKLEGLLCRVRSITAMSLPRRSRSRTPPERPRPTSASKGNGGDSGGGAKVTPTAARMALRVTPRAAKAAARAQTAAAARAKAARLLAVRAWSR